MKARVRIPGHHWQPSQLRVDGAGYWNNHRRIILHLTPQGYVEPIRIQLQGHAILDLANAIVDAYENIADAAAN